MPALKKLLERLDYQCVQGNPDIEISHLIYDSRKAGKDDLFVCIKGTAVDGHRVMLGKWHKKEPLRSWCRRM